MELAGRLEMVQEIVTRVGDAVAVVGLVLF